MTNQSLIQNKSKEIDFFGSHPPYEVFDPKTNEFLIDIFASKCKLNLGDRILDLGCGSGVFSEILTARGYQCIGIDLSRVQLGYGKSAGRDVTLVNADVEALPFPENYFDGILLIGLIHHLPNPNLCINEIKRVLKKGGRFLALDPNRANPFMYLYRDKSSPFYSSVGVSENEKPIVASNMRREFEVKGFKIEIDFISGLKYNHVESSLMKSLLPWYNFIDSLIFSLPFLRRFRPLVLITGTRP